MQVVKHWAPPWEEMTPEQRAELTRGMAEVYRLLHEYLKAARDAQKVLAEHLQGSEAPEVPPRERK